MNTKKDENIKDIEEFENDSEEQAKKRKLRKRKKSVLIAQGGVSHMVKYLQIF